MKKTVLVLALIILGFSFAANSRRVKIEKKELFKELKVKQTMYYTPIVFGLDYGVSNSIDVNGHKIYITAEEEESIRMEGCAELRVNTESLNARFVIDHKFNVVPYTMNAIGGKLKVNELAVDSSFIPINTTVFIGNENYKAKDTGKMIKNLHIDRFMGTMTPSEFKKKIRNFPDSITIKIKINE